MKAKSKRADTEECESAVEPPSKEKRKRADIQESKLDQESSSKQKQAKMDDSPSRIDPAAPLVPTAQLPDSNPKQSKVDDPVSRIDPSPPIVLTAQLPTLDAQMDDRNDMSKIEEELAKLPSVLDDELHQTGKESDESDFTVNIHRNDDLKMPAKIKYTDDELKMALKLAGDSENSDLERDVSVTKELKKGSSRTKKRKAASPKDTREDLERILNSPVKTGPPKNQRDVEDFFLREQALQRKKLQDSSERRRARGSDWYSKLKKTPEQIKAEKLRLRRKEAEERENEKKQVLERKVKARSDRKRDQAKKWREEEKIQEQDRKDRAIAKQLYKKYYKDELEKKGRSVARHLPAKLQEQLERDFEITNQLNPAEKKEWAVFMSDAKKETRRKKGLLTRANT